MTAEELLGLLHDIQPPPEPAWWLLAPAQLIAALIITLLAVAAWLILRRRRENHFANLAAQELNRIVTACGDDNDDARLALELSKWLKRVAMLAFPARQVAGLNGQPWLDFLDQSLGNNDFSRGEGRVFANGIYRRQFNPDATRLVALCEQWLSAIKPRLQRRAASNAGF